MRVQAIIRRKKRKITLNTTCSITYTECARDQNAYQKTGLIGRMFSCDRFGNYATTGCTGSVCFCQDRSGNPVGDTRVNIGQLDALNC
ncbi:hypothetical protein DPMN_186373 [Dreissena polymorpha]|uniref:Thyroglobulin type-1 domain-containing protein n=1 Tax=Dreissena polymorpha TaxID=45954 RepID=A0A9D4DN87_DREPO|nr:hypothetical protein DPMN_186373 [Dreissena polymorpha]